MAGMTGMQVWMTGLTRMTTITGMTKTQRFPGMTAMIRMTTVNGLTRITGNYWDD